MPTASEPSLPTTPEGVSTDDAKNAPFTKSESATVPLTIPSHKHSVAHAFSPIVTIASDTNTTTTSSITASQGTPRELIDTTFKVKEKKQINIRKASIHPGDEGYDLIDPVCDPKHPHRINFSDISSAAYSIRDGINRIPCMKAHQLSTWLGVDLYLKKEYLQVTGSFKERGARFALLRLTKEQAAAGAIAASAGNHALALAYHGQQLGIPITVIMPIFAPLMKVSCCKGYGATVIQHGHDIQDAKEFGFHYAREKGMTYINGFDHPDVVAGQGTIGLEILEEVKNLDAVIVPVGGGGLVAGVAMAIKTLRPEVEVIGVESETCPSFSNALFNSGLPVHPENSLADGLAVPTVGVNAVYMAKGNVDRIVTVCEESIALAILRCLEMEKSVVEGAGAVGLAALISNKLPHLKGKRVVNILSGGNIDSTVLGRTIERGLAVDGRLIKFDVVVSDRPGGIAELATLICKHGGSIKDMFHERAWLAANVFSVRVRVVAETRDHDHADILLKELEQHYSQISYQDYRPKFVCTGDESP